MTRWVGWSGEDINLKTCDIYTQNLAAGHPTELVGSLCARVNSSHAVEIFSMFPITLRPNRTRTDLCRASGTPPPINGAKRRENHVMVRPYPRRISDPQFSHHMYGRQDAASTQEGRTQPSAGQTFQREEELKARGTGSTKYSEYQGARYVVK